MHPADTTDLMSEAETNALANAEFHYDAYYKVLAGMQIPWGGGCRAQWPLEGCTQLAQEGRAAANSRPVEAVEAEWNGSVTAIKNPCTV
jgi:hypothetical protein